MPDARTDDLRSTLKYLKFFSVGVLISIIAVLIVIICYLKFADRHDKVEVYCDGSGIKRDIDLKAKQEEDKQNVFNRMLHFDPRKIMLPAGLLDPLLNHRDSKKPDIGTAYPIPPSLLSKLVPGTGQEHFQDVINDRDMLSDSIIPESPLIIAKLNRNDVLEQTLADLGDKDYTQDEVIPEAPIVLTKLVTNAKKIV